MAVLLDAGADANVLTATGATPLHFAATAGNADALTTLLDHGADANAREPVWGQTPLMFAAAADRGNALAALLARGADPAVTGTVVNIAARNETDRADSRRRRERMAALRDIWPFPPLVFFVLGGIFFGWFTPTEAGAVGAFEAHRETRNPNSSTALAARPPRPAPPGSWTACHSGTRCSVA